MHGQVHVGSPHSHAIHHYHTSPSPSAPTSAPYGSISSWTRRTEPTHIGWLSIWAPGLKLASQLHSRHSLEIPLPTGGVPTYPFGMQRELKCRTGQGYGCSEACRENNWKIENKAWGWIYGSRHKIGRLFFYFVNTFSSSMFMSIRADPLGKKEWTTEGTKWLGHWLSPLL